MGGNRNFFYPMYIWRMSIKFPFDQNAYHLTIRPTHGIPENFEKILVSKFEKYEYIILTFEGFGESRHCHILMAYNSASSNLHKIATRMLDTEGLEYGGNAVCVNRVNKTLWNSVSYLYKENVPSVVKGFKQTWIDRCIEESNKTVRSKHVVVKSHLVWETIVMYAKAKQMKLEAATDLPVILTCMNKEGYQFTNPKRAAQIMKQMIACVDEGYTNHFWTDVLGLNNIY